MEAVAGDPSCLCPMTVSSNLRKRAMTSFSKADGSVSLAEVTLAADVVRFAVLSDSSSWQVSPRLVQLTQGNCRLHLSLRDRQK